MAAGALARRTRLIIKILARSLAALLLLCLLALGGALVWLRSPQAEGFLAGLATRALAAQGLFLEVGELSGPLPQRLVLRDVRLSDHKGLVLTATAAELRFSPLQLLRGRLEIPLAALERPELFRLPEPTPGEPPSDSGAGFFPPVSVHLHLASVSGGLVHSPVLLPDRSEAEAPPFSPLSLEARADARLQGGRLEFSFQGSLLHADGSGLRARIALEADAAFGGGRRNSTFFRGEDDSLSLDVEAEEGPGGLSALLADRPDLPGYALRLAGEGSVREWPGRLRLALDAAPGNSPGAKAPPDHPPETGGPRDGLLDLDADIVLSCATGSLLRDIVESPDLELTLNLSARPGGGLPEKLSPFFGTGILAQAGISVEGEQVGAQAALRSEAWDVTLKNAKLTAGQGKGSASLSAELEGHARLAPLLAATDAEPPASFPVSALALRSDISVLTGGSTGPEPPSRNTFADVTLEARGKITATTEQQDFDADYRLDARYADDLLRLETLTLNGLGVNARASGRMNAENGALFAEADVLAEDDPPWQALLAELIGPAAPKGAEDANALGGSLRLNAELELAGRPEAAPGGPPEGPKDESAASAREAPAGRDGEFSPLAGLPEARGNLRLRGTGMRWPTARLDGLIGASPRASVSLSGGGAKPYSLVVEQLEAGTLSVSGTALFRPRGSPGAAGPLGLPAGELEADLRARAADVAALAGPNSGIGGSLSADLRANGPLDSPRLVLDLQSPALTLPSGPLRGLDLRVDALAETGGGQLAAEGTLRAAVRESPGGPLSLSGSWRAALPASGPKGAEQRLDAAVRNVDLQGAGVSLRADLRTAFSLRDEGAASLPLLDGNLKADVTDWNKLAALSGLPLSGGPANLEARLSKAGGRQNASLNFSLADLRLRREASGTPVFAVRDVSARLDASDLFRSPTLELALDAGRGMAGDLRWRTGQGRISGSNGTGGFSLALRRETKPGAKDSEKDAPGGDGRFAPSRPLFLQGSYNLPGREVTLSDFALYVPAQKAGFALRQPVTASFAKGLRVRGLDLAVLPSGRLAADAAFSPGNLSLDATLESLSLSAFSLFTEAALPDGEIQGQARFSTSAGGPGGSFALRGRLGSTQAALPSAAPGGDAPPPAKAAQTPASALDFSIQGELSASPGAGLVEGSGVRALPGVFWLRGQGDFGASGRQDAEKEGLMVFQIPLRADANGLPRPDGRAPLAARIRWDGVIDPLWRALPMPDRTLSGAGRFDIRATGSMNAPKTEVTAYLAGCYRDLAQGVVLDNLAVEAASTRDGNVRLLLAAKDSLQGALALEAALGDLSGRGGDVALDLRGRLERFRMFQRDDLNLDLSGVFSAEGPPAALQVKANIVVNEGDVDLAGRFGGSLDTLDVISREEAEKAEALGDAKGGTVRGHSLNVHIAVPRYLFIRSGDMLESEWRGDLRIQGGSAAPLLVGTLSPVRGQVEIFSRVFTLTGGEIAFVGNANPTLNVELTYEGPDFTAFLRAGGTGKKPALTLESSPPMPRDEVLARVMFGKSVSGLSRFEAIQLADNLRQLMGFGGGAVTDLLSSTRRRFGLDMLRIGGAEGERQRTTSGRAGERNLVRSSSTGGGSDDVSPALEAGKYINDSIFVGVEQGAAAGSTSVRVEVELFPRVTLQGKSSSDASEVGIGWRRDY